MEQRLHVALPPGTGWIVAAAAIFAGLWLIGPALPAEFMTRLPWYISRGAGITAYLLLSATTLLGLAISTRLTDRWLSRAAVYALHEHLSWLALGFVGLHAGVLLVDTYQPFRLIDVLVPFASGYRPAAVALGIVGAYLMVLLVASFYLRARLGYRAWRVFHYSSFGLYVIATLHGVLAGDTGSTPWMAWLYLVSGTCVLLLTNYRILLPPRAPVHRPNGT